MTGLDSKEARLVAVKFSLLSRFPITQRLANRAVWALYLAVCLSHIFSLPLLVAYDSQWYIHLADILGTSRFPEEWDFLRTPVFPELLRFCFWLWGRNALAVFGLQACFAAGGVYLLSRRLRGNGLYAEAALAVAAIALFPTVIAYQHILLSEIGSFFFLALIVYTVANPEPPSWKGALYIALAVALGYYHRSSLLYLSPVVAAIYAFGNYKSQPPGYLLRQAPPLFLIVALVPHVLAYPWQRNPKVAERTGQSVLLYGLVHQAVIPLNDPVMGGLEAVYAKVVSESKTNGVLPNSGLTSPHEGEVVSPVEAYGAAGSRIFTRIVTHNPVEYSKGVGRNLAMMTGFDLGVHDNAVYRHIIFSARASQIDPGPSSFPELGNQFRLTTSANFTAEFLDSLSPLYDWLIRFGILATIAGLLLGLWRLDRFILSFTAPPLAFILIHAFVLLSQDRMILPAQPIFIFNLIMLPAWLMSFYRNRIPVPDSK